MYILVVLFSKSHMNDRNNCISQLHKFNFATQHVLFISTRFLRHTALHAELDLFYWHKKLSYLLRKHTAHWQIKYKEQILRKINPNSNQQNHNS